MVSQVKNLGNANSYAWYEIDFPRQLSLQQTEALNLLNKRNRSIVKTKEKIAAVIRNTPHLMNSLVNGKKKLILCRHAIQCKQPVRCRFFHNIICLVAGIEVLKEHRSSSLRTPHEHPTPFQKQLERKSEIGNKKHSSLPSVSQTNDISHQNFINYVRPLVIIDDAGLQESNERGVQTAAPL